MTRKERYQQLRASIPGDADQWIIDRCGVKPQTVRLWNCASSRAPSDANLRLIESAIASQFVIETIN